jgi:hypothetical protein
MKNNNYTRKWSNEHRVFRDKYLQRPSAFTNCKDNAENHKNALIKTFSQRHKDRSTIAPAYVSMKGKSNKQTAYIY